MPKHLVELYQASIKDKEKGIEMNFANHINLEDSPVFLDSLNGRVTLVLMFLIYL
jgi:hypothetical protein